MLVFRRRMNIIANICLTFALMIVLLTGGLYAWESGQTADDYIIYYGNVTTKSSFVLPEPVSSYSFGKWIGKNEGPITFVNNMWCKPIDQDVSPQVINTRLKTFDSFAFVNTIPKGISFSADTSEALRVFFSFGADDRDEIRKVAVEQNYLKWDMGAIAPEENSQCYIDAGIVVYTTIFKLPKTLALTGNSFNYYVE